MNTYSSYIRDIPDYPKPGIVFKDLTPLLLNAKKFKQVISKMANWFEDQQINIVLGVEARGFFFAPSIAMNLNAGFMPIRKPKKLPGPIFSVDYELEYGRDTICLHQDQMPKGSRVLLVDDVLATGGTIMAAKKLVEKAGGEVIGCAFCIELSFLNGRKQLPTDLPIHSVITY